MKRSGVNWKPARAIPGQEEFEPRRSFKKYKGSKGEFFVQDPNVEGTVEEYLMIQKELLETQKQHLDLQKQMLKQQQQQLEQMNKSIGVEPKKDEKKANISNVTSHQEFAVTSKKVVISDTPTAKKIVNSTERPSSLEVPVQSRGEVFLSSIEIFFSGVNTSSFTKLSSSAGRTVRVEEFQPKTHFVWNPKYYKHLPPTYVSDIPPAGRKEPKSPSLTVFLQ